MPSSKEKQVSKLVIDAFKIAVNHNPAFKALPRSFKKAFADSVLPHIDNQFGQDEQQTKRFVFGTVKMASNDSALQDALNTASEASANKRRFKNYGVVIEHLQRAKQTPETPKAAQVTAPENI